MIAGALRLCLLSVASDAACMSCKHGTCVKDFCACEFNWAGNDCSLFFEHAQPSLRASAQTPHSVAIVKPVAKGKPAAIVKRAKPLVPGSTVGVKIHAYSSYTQHTTPATARASNRTLQLAKAAQITSFFARPIGIPTVETASASHLLHHSNNLVTAAVRKLVRTAQLRAHKHLRWQHEQHSAAHQDELHIVQEHHKMLAGTHQSPHMQGVVAVAPSGAPSGQSAVFSSTPPCACTHGKCLTVGCVCDEGWTGVSCDTPRCTKDCSLRGVCLGSMCVCETGFYGSHCQHVRCPDDCNSNGYCFQGQCQCAVGYGGAACSFVQSEGKTAKIQLQPSESTGRQPTADDALSLRSLPPKACPENCHNRGECIDAHCNCFSGYSGDGCQHGCLNECSHQGDCVDGACLCFAGFLGVDCSEKGCCNGHGTCDDPGECVCFEGWTGDTCDTMVMCPDPACSGHGTCKKGKCHCDAGFDGPVCVASGGCVPPCSPTGFCNPGTKICECQVGFTGPLCDKGVRECDNFCSHNGLCLNGQCMCAEGWQGKDCSQPFMAPGAPRADTNLKGADDADDGALREDAGLEAGPGIIGLGGAKEGGTGIVCGEGGLCSGHGQCDTTSGQCVCATGWRGADCALAVCPGPLGNECTGRGLCDTAFGVCQCASGYAGNDCAEKTCPTPCGIHGSCADGICLCHQGWTGDQCGDPQCPNDCSNHGECTPTSSFAPPECHCHFGFVGGDCSRPAFVARTCASNCSGNGLCLNGRCACNVGFHGVACDAKVCADETMTGPNCDIPRCLHDCHGHGLCMRGNCSCQKEYVGKDCALPIFCVETCEQVCEVDSVSEKCVFCIGQCQTARGSLLGRHDPFDDLKTTLLEESKVAGNRIVGRRKHAEVSVETLRKHAEVYVEKVA